MGNAITIVRAEGEGEQRWFLGGGTHTWKATAQETDGAFLLFEDELTQGKTTPLHRHPQAIETLYVLEGAIVVHLDGAEHPVEQGGVTVAPAGTPHAFLVTSRTARLLTMQTPGGTDAFFRGASEPTTAGSDAVGTVDLARVRAAAEQHGGVEILGPPPFETG